MKINSIEELRAADEKNRYVPNELTPYQIKMLDNQLSKPDSKMWNNAFCIKFNKDIKLTELQEVVSTVISRHPIYNIRIYMDADGVIRQQYCPQFVSVKTKNVSDGEMEGILNNYAKPFCIFNNPLFRAEIYKTTTAVYVLLDAHHLVADASAGKIVMNEIVETYLNREKEWEPDYYLGFMALEREYRLTEEYAKEKEFYEKTYEGGDWYNIPEPDFDTVENKGGFVEKYLNVGIQTLARAESRCHITRSRLANIAALLALSKYGNADNVMMTWIYHNRMGLGRDRMGGMLISELPIAARLKEFETMGELILHVNRQMKETTKNVSYDYIVKNEATFRNDPLEVNYFGSVIRVDKYIEKLVEDYGADYIEMEVLEQNEVAEARMELDIIELQEETPDKQLLMTINCMASLYKMESLERFADIYALMFKRLSEADKDTKISELLK